MSPLGPDGETAKPSLGYVWGGSISVTAPTAQDYQRKVGENITMVHLRVLPQDLDEKHSE